MTHNLLLYGCLFLALWSAIVGGVFSAFSEFVMSALLKTEPSGGIEAMQHINRDVIGTQFVAGIIAIAILSVCFAIYGLAVVDGSVRIVLLLAPIVYLPSVFLMTIFGNVLMNNRLEQLEHTSSQARICWQHYGRRWTRLNHIRSIGSVATACLYLSAAIMLTFGGEIQ